ncbi:putative DNA helicase ino80 [Bonamia ostreae]|uniref:Chromatin-remodeling ATPase INO80 n=1 Tax=Bonamia ostreae TaxID=126728 RepID=A0ABV2AJA9_9EUKA
MDFKRTFGTNMSKIEKLSKDQLLTDCGKLTALDKLLKEFKILILKKNQNFTQIENFNRKRKNGHRVLIFSQMTKMLDILQDYCHIRRYKFLRLDGSTQITDRTIMVKQFQRDTSVFIFLLSTRAGGLGINLTAADTVIFYDNDWNPTMDAQAMDRVHRIGQKKQVTVYRIICSNTVEERVWKVAQQKFKIQKSVYSGGFKFAKEKRKKKSSKSPNNDDEEDSKIFKPNQLKKMILDDESD